MGVLHNKFAIEMKLHRMKSRSSGKTKYLCFFPLLWLFESEFLQLETMQLLCAKPHKLNVTSKHHLCSREGWLPWQDVQRHSSTTHYGVGSSIDRNYKKCTRKKVIIEAWEHSIREVHDGWQLTIEEFLKALKTPKQGSKWF